VIVNNVGIPVPEAQQDPRSTQDAYVSALFHARLGFSLVSCAELLEHLNTTYGTITSDQLSTNKNRFSSEWNTDAPIEDLWTRTEECRTFATAGDEPIPESETVRTLLGIIEKSGLLATAVADWRKRSPPDMTLDNFKGDFTHANTERIRTLTVGNTGHSANAAITPNAASTPPVSAGTPFVSTAGTKMYYCWSHGLGTNATHCSSTCNNNKEGHVDNATAITMQGGSNRIMSGFRPAAGS
jgi:hypothetical protein